MAFLQYRECYMYYYLHLKDQTLMKAEIFLANAHMNRPQSIFLLNKCMNKRIICHPVTHSDSSYINFNTSSNFLGVGASTGESSTGPFTCICSTTDLQP